MKQIGEGKLDRVCHGWNPPVVLLLGGCWGR